MANRRLSTSTLAGSKITVADCCLRSTLIWRDPDTPRSWASTEARQPPQCIPRAWKTTIVSPGDGTGAGSSTADFDLKRSKMLIRFTSLPYIDDRPLRRASRGDRARKMSHTPAPSNPARLRK